MSKLISSKASQCLSTQFLADYDGQIQIIRSVTQHTVRICEDLQAIEVSAKAVMCNCRTKFCNILLSGPFWKQRFLGSRPMCIYRLWLQSTGRVSSPCNGYLWLLCIGNDTTGCLEDFLTLSKTSTLSFPSNATVRQYPLEALFYVRYQGA